MSISEEDVLKIAQLARLRLEPAEVKLYQSQLGKILDSIQELSAIDTSHVEPTNSVLGLTNITRPDEPRPFCDTEALLAHAPQREGPYFKVKKVIE